MQLRTVLMLLIALVGLTIANEDVAAVSPSAGSAALPVKQTTSLIPTDAITIPGMLSYQGRLTDTLGRPVEDGNYQMTFRLYQQETGGSPFWTENQTVRVKSGLFSVLLGAVRPITSVPENGEVWLSLQLGTEPELAPRLRIVSSAYSFLSEKAQTLDQNGAGVGQVLKWNGTAWAAANDEVGGDNAWVRGTPDSVLYTVRQLGIARGGANNMLWGNNLFTHVNLGVACTTGTNGQDYGYCTVGGGYRNTASGYYATVAGGNANFATHQGATVGGGFYNKALEYYATVAGGDNNTVRGSYATVGGGDRNTASGAYATVAGGYYNTASGTSATVAGGDYNTATGFAATVGGGEYNTVSGNYATVPGGYNNVARGYASFAAGRYARANHNGSFVWSDSAVSLSESVYTTAQNQFRVRARGGTWFFSNAGMTTGVVLASGSNSWASACDSTNKTDFAPVDKKELLRRVAELRVRYYRMKDQTDGTRHLGPVAQDFKNAFGVGESDKTINMADADGVLFAAIQALYEENQELIRRIEALETQLKQGR